MESKPVCELDLELDLRPVLEQFVDLSWRQAPKFWTKQNKSKKVSKIILLFYDIITILLLNQFCSLRVLSPSRRTGHALVSLSGNRQTSHQQKLSTTFRDLFPAILQEGSQRPGLIEAHSKVFYYSPSKVHRYRFHIFERTFHQQYWCLNGSH